MDWWSNFQWEPTLAALSIVVAGIIGFLQIRAALPKPRSRLKTDLEVLNLIGDKHEMYDPIRKRADALLLEIYSQPPPLSRAGEKRVVRLRIFWALVGTGFAYWTFYLIHHEWSWWALLTGYAAVGSLGNLYLAPRWARKRYG